MGWMFEGFCIAALGIAICCSALFRRYPPSWGSAGNYAVGGLGLIVVGLIVIAFNALL